MPGIIRLNSFLSRCGICSRRQADKYISEGRVKVNNIVVTVLGTKIETDNDIIEFDGKKINIPRENSYFILNKPAGVVTTLYDPQERKTIRSYTEEIGIRLFPMGRLDYDSEGLIILTDDGELSHRIQHPRYGIEKVYVLETDNVLNQKELSKIRKGIMLDDGLMKVLSIRINSKSARGASYRITIAEGRKRVLRRLFDKIG
ncbi:unnamed protein product, partial [marine sediment metagenome]